MKFIFAASRILGLYPYDGKGLSTRWLLISIALQFGTTAANILHFIDIYPRNEPINLSESVDFALIAVQFLSTNLHFFRAIFDRRVFDSTKSASKRKGSYWVDFATVSQCTWNAFVIALFVVLTDMKPSVWELVTYYQPTLTYLIVLQYTSSVSIKSLEIKKLRRYIGKYPESACLHLYKIADQVEDIHRAYSPQLIFVLMKTLTAAVYFGFKALTSGSPLKQGVCLGIALENLAWVLFIQLSCSSFSQQYTSSVSIKSLEIKKLRRYIGKYPESACLHLYKIADQVEDIHRAYSPQLIFVLMKTLTAAVYFGFKALTSGSPLKQGVCLGIALENLAWVLFIQLSCSSFSQQIQAFYCELHRVVWTRGNMSSNKKMCLYATIERKVEFRTCGFLTLGNPLFTSTIAAATTYLVILLQFK